VRIVDCSGTHYQIWLKLIEATRRSTCSMCWYVESSLRDTCYKWIY